MRRREFIVLLGSAAAAWPLAARAQQGLRVQQRIGLLMPLAANDPEIANRLTLFRQSLHEFGWTLGRNVVIEDRYFAGDPDRARKYAAELLATAPDVLLCVGSPALRALREATRTVPIVFMNVYDPVGAGFVASIAKPDGNATGFTPSEYGVSVKWLEILKEIAPRVAEVAVLRDLAAGGALGQFGALQAAAPSLRVQLVPIEVKDSDTVEQSISAFARRPNGGLLVLPSGPAAVHRRLIITLAARHRLPAVYAYRYYIADGGLISYGVDVLDEFRRAANYISRILNGEKPANLPVQAPTKYELVINLKTAKALGLTVPPTLFAIADEVIE